jgi:hypothetical protein
MVSRGLQKRPFESFERDHAHWCSRHKCACWCRYNWSLSADNPIINNNPALLNRPSKLLWSNRLFSSTLAMQESPTQPPHFRADASSDCVFVGMGDPFQHLFVLWLLEFFLQCTLVFMSKWTTGPLSSVEGLQVALEVKLLFKRSRNSRGSRRATRN